MKRTFVDAGVLIAAARGTDEIARRAMRVLDDPDREFASSAFVKLEVLPKAIYHKRQDESEFYREFFSAVALWADDVESVVGRADQYATSDGLAALDALHVAAAALTGCDELVTYERPTKPICRAKAVKVASLHDETA